MFDSIIAGPSSPSLALWFTLTAHYLWHILICVAMLLGILIVGYCCLVCGLLLMSFFDDAKYARLLQKRQAEYDNFVTTRWADAASKEAANGYQC